MYVLSFIDKLMNAIRIAELLPSSHSQTLPSLGFGSCLDNPGENICNISCTFKYNFSSKTLSSTFSSFPLQS